jgi:hypothetical protein
MRRPGRLRIMIEAWLAAFSIVAATGILAAGFPVGMYAVASHALSVEIDSRPLGGLGRVAFWRGGSPPARGQCESGAT